MNDLSRVESSRNMGRQISQLYLACNSDKQGMKLETMSVYIQKTLLRQWRRLKGYLAFLQILYSPSMQMQKMVLLEKEEVHWPHLSRLHVPCGLHFYDMLIYSIHQRRAQAALLALAAHASDLAEADRLRFYASPAGKDEYSLTAVKIARIVNGSAQGNKPKLGKIGIMGKDLNQSAPALVKSSKKNKWKPEEIQSLIQMRGEMNDKFQSVKGRMVLWEEISGSMLNQGISRTPAQCKSLWTSLVQKYEESKRDEESKKAWPYFSAMDRILSCEGEMATK